MYVGRGDGEMTIILDEKREMNVFTIQKKRLTNV